MADVRISDLPAAEAVADTDITIIDDGVTTRRATAGQMRAGLLRSVVFDQILGSPIEPTAAALGLDSIAGLMWHDTGSGILKKRDQADTVWIDMGRFDETTKKFVVTLTAATTTVSGISREATIAEATSGTSTTPSALPHVTPEGVAAALVPVKDRTTALETARGRSEILDCSGKSELVFSGIPAGVKKIRIVASHISMPASQTNFAVQLINASGTVSSGYTGSVSNVGPNTVSVANTTFIALAYPYSGNYLTVIADIVRFPGRDLWGWALSGGFGATANSVSGGGHVGAGTITSIKLYTGGPFIVSGEAFIEWEK